MSHPGATKFLKNTMFSSLGLDDKHDKMLRAMFEYDERTEHKGIIPARERIKQYKTKTIRRNLPSALPTQPH